MRFSFASFHKVVSPKPEMLFAVGNVTARGLKVPSMARPSREIAVLQMLIAYSGSRRMARSDSDAI
jgi:hypothetical protein